MGEIRDIVTNAEGFLVRDHCPHPTTAAVIRFLEKIRVGQVSTVLDSPCWNWQGCKSRNGYGQFKVEARRGMTRKTGPHVFAYEYFIGPVPEGFDVHHRCYNRACCNPLHLEAVSHRKNMLDGDAQTIPSVNAQKTHCTSGHLLAGDNLHITRQGARFCRACNARRQRDFQARKRAANNT